MPQDLPPGFVLDEPLPAPPEGFVVDRPQMRGQTTGTDSQVLSQGLSGLNERLVPLLRRPTQALESLGVPQGVARALPLGGLDVIGEGIENFSVAPPIDTPAARIARRTGQVVGETLPLAAGAFGGASTLPATATRSETLLGGVVERILRGTKAAPATAAGGELAATTLAGVGSGIAGEVAPGNALVDFGAQMAGGFAPSILVRTPTALGVRLTRNLIQRLSPSATARAAQREVARVLGPEIGPRAEAGIQEGQQLAQDIPGFQPSLAEATGSQGLLATQRGIERRASGQQLEQLAARRQGNVEAVNRFADNVAPAAPNSPAFVVDTASGRVQDIRADLDAQTVTNLQQRTDLAESLPTVDRASQGQIIRDRLIQIRRDASTRMSRLATDLGINDADVTVQFEPVRRQIVDDFSPGSVFEDARNFPEVLDVLRSLPEGQTVTFADLKALRERLTDDLLDAQSSASPSRKRIRVLSALQERVDSVINDLTEVADPGLADRYRQFRQTYFNEYIEPFERGAAFTVRQRDGRGFYRIPDEQVAAAFFGARDVSGARQFKAAFGDDPDATAALASTVMDSLRDSAVRDGVIDPRRFENWRRAHESVLAEFPEIAAEVSNIQSASQALSARQAQLDLRLKTVNDSILARRLQAVSRGTQTPEQLISSAVADPRQMRSLVASLRDDPAALEALRRHVWDNASGLSPQQLAAFMDNNAPSLSRLFGVRHLSDLRRIQRARMMIESVPAPRGQGFRPDPTRQVADQLGSGVPQIQSRIFAAESGRTSFRFVAGDMFARFFRSQSQQASEALLNEALYNPQVARDLAGMIDTSALKPEATSRLNAWLFNLGINQAAAESPDAQSR